jgi:hypothetical protein
VRSGESTRVLYSVFVTLTRGKLEGRSRGYRSGGVIVMDRKLTAESAEGAEVGRGVEWRGGGDGLGA